MRRAQCCANHGDAGGCQRTGLGSVSLPGAILLLLVGIMFSGLLPITAEAAVRVCKRPVIGDIVEDPSHDKALKGAIENWRRKTRVWGLRFGSWKLALGRRYRCARVPSSDRFACVAVGRPCTLRQTPPRRGFGDNLRPRPGLPPPRANPLPKPLPKPMPQPMPKRPQSDTSRSI